MPTMSDFAMTATWIRRWGACLVTGCAMLLFATPASAQFFGNGQLPNNGNNALPIFPTLGPAPGNNLTQQQLQSLMMMRAMSGMRRHGVQTGFPQNIPLGNSGFGGAPVQLMSPTTSESQTTHKSSAQKRAEARKLREDQKHAVRQDEKSKKAKAAKKARGDNQQHAAK
jgi:hypothetical protein